MNNVVIGGRTDRAGDDDPWVYYETVGGGQGGRPGGRPGMSGVHTGMTNTRNTPVEALERAFPLRVHRSTLRRGSGGDGDAPGGEGIDRALELLADATVSLITERRAKRPWGLDGGGDGAPGANAVDAGDGLLDIGDKCTLHLRAGAVLHVRTPGGGATGTRDDAPAGSVRPG
jgi:N-methylhydantoinase B/oxoprolinase/acetone carboxylase alpha subunit